MNKESIIKNGILGFILADAVGVPYEFKMRKNIIDVDMIGNGSHNVPKGYWSDDSSMVIATIDSIIKNKDINYINIMDNFMLWAEKKDFNINNYTFGIGRTTLNALKCYKYKNEYKEYENPINCGQNNFNDNGNGSLMRILPIAYYCFYNKLNNLEIYEIVKNISSMTHKHNISIMGCYIYVLYVIELLKGNNKFDCYNYIRNYDYKMFDNETIIYYDRLLNSDISNFCVDDIKSSGFIVDTLEAVIWSFLNNDNYKDCIINAIKLGDDTDTIGALVGALSGIYYKDIPKDWLNCLMRYDYLVNLCEEFAKIFN